MNTMFIDFLSGKFFLPTFQKEVFYLDKVDFAFLKLKEKKKSLSKKQYMTIKGQIKSGDIDGALKGIETSIKKRIKMWKTLEKT